MENGRPADNSHMTNFYKQGVTKHVSSKQIKEDVSGRQVYTGQIDKETRQNGKGKQYFDNGNIFEGVWLNNTKDYGEMYELQSDGTHNLFYVEYDGLNETMTEICQGLSKD